MKYVKVIKSSTYSIGKKIDSKDVLKVIPIDSNHKFVLLSRDTFNMRGQQDKFYMAIVDKKGKIVIPLGSHPSKKGALTGFYKNRIKDKTIDELREEFSHMM